ncbi:uncharacterized protein [Embiotoca jacksoni]|uniref:uncharacterized protein n=1 Tax=Embiotoca jacksoni TaxID=100190 RepID=UPI003704BDF7
MIIDGCRKFNFGRESLRRNRTIVLLGATGSGKSTLINGMINYLVGVEWKDDLRFKLINEVHWRSEDHSQTSEITVYKINHQEGFKIDYSLTIVDTPGFGDTRGIKRDELITEQLCTLFSTEDGVREVDAVCFVAPAASTELTEAQQYVFDSVLSIFGKDVAENIQVLVTFADDKLPPVLEVISASDTPCPETTNGLPVHFIFNNEALFAHNQAASTDDDQFDENFEEFWTMGTNSMEWFFAGLNVMHTKSLILTTELLRERHQLQNVVESFKRQIKLGLAKLDELKETAEKLRDHEAEVSRNENFEFEVTVMRPFKESIATTEHFATNCPQCHVTCHYPCSLPTDAWKRSCAAMGSDGSCMMCPRKCNGKVHLNQTFRWKHKQVKEKQTVKELRQKYKGAPGKKITVQGLSEKLKEEYGRVQTEVVKVMQSSTKCLNRLQEIALKPNPVSAPDNIDLLIQGEKSEDKQGGKKRVLPRIYY